MKDLLAIGALIALAPASHAAVLFDNGAPMDGDLVPFLGAEKGNDFRCESADDFTLPAGAGTIREIRWWGDYFFGAIDAPVVDDFSLTVYETSPATQAPSQMRAAIQVLSLTRTWVELGVVDAFQYTATIRDLTLETGKPYWLGIANESGAAGLWGWRTSNYDGTSYSRDPDTLAFEEEGANAAFMMTDRDIPAPGALALLGTGLVIGTARARRRD